MSYEYTAGEIHEVDGNYQLVINCITAKTANGSLLVKRNIDAYNGKPMKTYEAAKKVQAIVLDLLQGDGKTHA